MERRRGRGKANKRSRTLSGEKVAMEETTLSDALKRGNPVVFFDVTVGGRAIGRIKMELFKDTAPRVSAVRVSESPRVWAPSCSHVRICLFIPCIHEYVSCAWPGSCQRCITLPVLTPAPFSPSPQAVENFRCVLFQLVPVSCGLLERKHVLLLWQAILYRRISARRASRRVQGLQVPPNYQRFHDSGRRFPQGTCPLPLVVRMDFGWHCETCAISIVAILFIISCM